MKYVEKNVPNNVRIRYRHYHQGNVPLEVLEVLGVNRVTVCELVDKETNKILSQTRVGLARFSKVLSRKIALGKALKQLDKQQQHRRNK